jgi:hypothetical protein
MRNEAYMKVGRRWTFYEADRVDFSILVNLFLICKENPSMEKIGRRNLKNNPLLCGKEARFGGSGNGENPNPVWACNFKSYH